MLPIRSLSAVCIWLSFFLWDAGYDVSLSMKEEKAHSTKGEVVCPAWY